MRKKQVLYIALALIMAIILMPGNVAAKGKNEVLTCNYEYNGRSLTYKVYSDGTIKLPFTDGEKDETREWYHGYEFDSIFLSSMKTSTNESVCPTITIEESDSYYTVFNNPRTKEDCNGTCNTISAKENAVQETIVLNSVGVYNSTSYFIPSFRLLNDGTKEWSLDGKTYANVNTKANLKENDKVATITLSEDFINKLFTEEVEIYRCIDENGNYTFASNEATCSTNKLSEQDGQATSASSYHGSLGTTTEDLEGWFEDDDVSNCGSGGILGDVNDPNSVAWLLQQLLNYLRALGPMIVIIMSGVEYTKVIISGDDDGMAKANKKLIYRLLLVAALFFVPTIVLALLDLFGYSNDPTCGLE